MKKRRLKKWVRYTIATILIIVIGFILAHLFLKGLNRLDNIAAACDKTLGHTCSYYEVNLYSKGVIPYEK